MDRLIKVRYTIIRDNGVLWCKSFDINAIEQSQTFNPDAIRQRFTGIHDAKGVEIYEDDRVTDGEKLMTISYNQQACAFWLTWTDQKGISRYQPLQATFGDDTGYYSNDSLEVIGQIHGIDLNKN